MRLNLIKFKMETKKDFKNELMNRRELSLIVDSVKNPSFAEMSKVISEEFKCPEENIMVENVKGKFGSQTFLVKASIYTSKELKDESFKRLTKAKKEAAPAA